MAVDPNMDTAPKAANRLSRILDAYAAAGHQVRFPVDVNQLLRGAAEQFGYDDPVLEVKSERLPSFEAGLFRVTKGWVVVYNETVQSSGRIRFSLAHELGHYLLHRGQNDNFQCSQQDMLGRTAAERVIEQQADEFASTLLMPLNHFREQVDDKRIDFEMLGACAELFGVSLTSTALRWVSATAESAVLVLARDGYMDWAVSSKRALQSGAYFKTRGQVRELPAGALASNLTVPSSKSGQEIAASAWFEHAHPAASLREMKLACDNYGYTLSLLHLSSGESMWAPRECP